MPATRDRKVKSANCRLKKGPAQGRPTVPVTAPGPFMKLQNRYLNTTSA